MTYLDLTLYTTRFSPLKKYQDQALLSVSEKGHLSLYKSLPSQGRNFPIRKNRVSLHMRILGIKVYDSSYYMNI